MRPSQTVWAAGRDQDEASLLSIARPAPLCRWTRLPGWTGHCSLNLLCQNIKKIRELWLARIINVFVFMSVIDNLLVWIPLSLSIYLIPVCLSIHTCGIHLLGDSQIIKIKYQLLSILSIHLTDYDSVYLSI